MNEPIKKQMVPADAFDFIDQKKLLCPIMTSFGDGGYSMYRKADLDGNLDCLATIDGRTNVNPPEISYGDESKVHNAHAGWKKLLLSPVKT